MSAFASNASLAASSSTPFPTPNAPIGPPQGGDWYDTTAFRIALRVFGPFWVAYLLYWIAQAGRQRWGRAVVARPPDTTEEEVEMDFTGSSDGISLDAGIDLEVGLGPLPALPRRTYHPRSHAHRVRDHNGAERAPDASEEGTEVPLDRTGVCQESETQRESPGGVSEDERLEVDAGLGNSQT